MLFPSGAAAGPTYAITNARIVPVSGPVIEKGSVVMRDGVIVAVGANVPIPADAIVIDGTGLHVYPGLIDGHTNFAVPRPRTQQQAQATPQVVSPFAQQAPAVTGQRGVFEPDTSNDPGIYLTPPARGITPQMVVARELEPGSEKATMLGVGVTSVLSAPREGILRGQSAVLNLNDGEPAEMVVSTPFALHVSLAGGGFGGGGGGYPSAQIGMIAAFRQALLDAQWYAARKAQWERHGGKGIPRPPYSPASEALQDALAGRQPVVFSVTRANDILKALRLANEFNLRAIIETGGEAWKVAGDLKKAGVPVIVSLNFRPAAGGRGGFGGGFAREEDPEEQRQLEQEAVRNAAELIKAGVPVAFSSTGLTNYADVIVNARRAAEPMGKDKALEALTIRAAEILGVATSLGTIEPGKIANLIVTTGHPLDPGTQLRYVFVDGQQVRFRAPEAPRGPAGGRPQPGASDQEEVRP
jgi:imidazolonepropionase-like amidohydrolase